MAPSVEKMKAFAERMRREKLAFKNDFSDILEKEFPGDVSYFCNWYSEQEVARRRQQRTVRPRPTGQELLHRIMNISFRSRQDRAEVMDVLESNIVPFIPVGRTNGWLYKLSPGISFLAPSKDQSRPQPIGHHRMDTGFLGVNYNVEPVNAVRDPKRIRRQQNFTEESTRSDDSDDTPNGFVFHQLGALFWCTEQIKPGMTQEQMMRKTWLNSGYGVVVKIERNGSAGAVYAVHNFWPEDLNMGERYHIGDENWGADLPHTEEESEQISIAKIADSVGQFSMDYNIIWEDMKNYEVELVRVLRTQSDTFIRETIQP